MRITLITIGSRGDIQPFVPLAMGLQAAGHQVRIATHAPYEDFVRRHHLDFHPVTGNPQEIMSGDSGLSWLESGSNPLTFLKRLRDVAVEMLDQMGRDCWAASQDAEAILFSTLGIFTGMPIAEKLGVPGIATYLQPISKTRDFTSVVFPPLPEYVPGRSLYNQISHDIAMEINWHLFGEAFNRVRVDLLGLPTQTRSFRLTMEDPYPLVYGFSPYVIPHPPDWGQQIRVGGYWFLDDPEWQPSPDLRDFLRAGSQPVYLGFGSMTQRDSGQVTDVVLRGIQKSGQRAVLLSGWGGIGSHDLPDSIFRLDYAPHSWLFPRMAAVVHHGGAGTTAAGLRAGIPSIVVPHFADQPFWARRVAMLGVGPQPIPQKRLTADSLAYAIHVTITNAAMRQRAAALGEKIRAEDGVGNAVRHIEQILEH